jgi:hypothetical protein
MERLWRSMPVKLPILQTVRPGLSVPNLDDFHKKMLEMNVPCAQAPKEMFGAKIAQYVDPDGLSISVGEERR